MKQLILLLGLCLFSLTSQAQPGGRDGEDRLEVRAERLERVKAARQAFIAEELALSAKEAAAFFPVFWRYEEKMRSGMPRRERDKQQAGRTDLTEAEALALMRSYRQHRQEMVDLKTEAENAFLKILPATKVIRLPEVEKAFRKRLWERAKGLREQRRN